MLKTFRGFDATAGLRLPEPGAALGWLRALLCFLLAAVVAAVLSRATFLGGLAPFALALFAAGVTAGGRRGSRFAESSDGGPYAGWAREVFGDRALQVPALLAGCLLGSLGGRLDGMNASLPAGCAIVLGGDLLWSAASPGLGRLRAALRRAPEIQARSPNPSVRAAALAGLGVLGPGLVMAGAEPWASALATCAALAAVAAAPFLRAAMAVNPGRRCLSAEEKAGLALLCAMLAAGLCGLWPPLALCLSMAAALLACPAGAAAGIAQGCAMLVMSSDARYLAALAVGGGIAQLCARRRVSVMIPAAAFAALASGAAMGLAPAALGGLCAAVPLALAVPEPARQRLRAWFAPAPAACDPERLAAIVRGQSAGQLRAMGAAFGELAEGYLTPGTMPDEQALMNRLRGELCDGCAAFDACWAGESNRAARLLCDLVGMAVAWSEGPGEAALFEEGVPADVSRRCRRHRAIPDRLGGMLEDFARARRSELRRGGENRLISAQFLQAQRLLEDMAAAQSRPIRLRNRQAQRAASALEQAGYALSDALMISGRRTELVLTLREGRWSAGMASRAAALLGERLGRVYAPVAAGEQTLRLARMPKLRAQTGIAGSSREAGVPSGDSHLAAMLDDDRLLIVLCDGMGSGEAAARESASAVRLLGRFLAAGAAWPLAVETANALMLNAGGEDMFSTMDMLLLDLSTGLAEFVKLAACPALIARSGEISRVEGGRLPLGILERVNPTASRARLMPGDVILMASDGVMDAAPSDALAALLADPGDDMNALAERVLALACEGTYEGRRDDMTAVCVRIEMREGSA